MRVKRTNLLLFFILLLWIGQSVCAQQQPQLEHLLNAVDTPSTWLKTPVSGTQPQGLLNSGNPSSVPSQAVQYPANAMSNSSPYFNQSGNALFDRQQMLRMFLGGQAPPKSSNDNRIDYNSGTVYSDWQAAENQASRAHNAEGKARYEKNKGYCESDASEAYYAANAARAASDRIYQASMNGDPKAKEYADRARAAADRARADADRARYYADSRE